MIALFLPAALSFFAGDGTAPSQALAPFADAYARAAETSAAQQPAAPAAETAIASVLAVQPAPETREAEAEAEPQSESQGEPAEAEPLPAPETVAAQTGPQMSETEAARARAWFEGVQTLRGRFTQISPDGSQTAGDLALQRPGRVRFDYDDPSPVLLVADGATVAIADFDLETVDRAPISATPLRFLLGDSEAIEAAVTEAGRAQGKLYITLTDPDGEVDGRLTLVFADPDASAPAEAMVLEGWYAVDAMGGLTEVSLTGLERGVRLDPRLFVLDDEDVQADDRRRGRR
ncbi:MAG: outer-membrane lipoprotein carrier protein LolA [Oceanicaulis sp.]